MSFSRSVISVLGAASTVVALAGAADTARAQCEATELVKLLGSETTGSDRFGYSVAIWSETMLVGALHDEGATSGSGSTYVFRYDGAAWVEEARLFPPDGASGDFFGGSVAVYGNSAVIGASGDDDHGDRSGSAYAFRYNGSIWGQEAKLLPSDVVYRDRYGWSVALWGNTAVVGAPLDDDNGSDAGSGYVFRYNGSAWIQEAKLLPDDGAPDDWFGYSVGISDDTVVIGAPQDNDLGGNSGSAYVFHYDGLGWVQGAKLLASDGAQGDCFGHSVAISGATAIVGAPQDDDNGSSSGSAYVFRYDGSSWVQSAKLLAFDGAPGDRFGTAVAVVGEGALIGAPLDDDNGDKSGSAYLFRYDGSNWNQEAKLLASDGQDDERLGLTVGIWGDTGVAGVPYAEPGWSGSTCVFRGLSDCNGNGTSDLCDVTDGTSEDCNANAIPDECDLDSGTSQDVNSNGIPDECEDCDENGLPDECDLDCSAAGGACDVPGCGLSADCNTNAIPDTCEPDCNANDTPDDCDIADGTSPDCNVNAVPDECDIAVGTSKDCNSNGVPDECDTASGASDDCNDNTIPDECEHDCNANGIPDNCDIADGVSQDDNTNGIPDECECDANEMGKLLAADGARGDLLACSVSISAGIAVTGAYRDDDNGSQSGSAYVFRYDDSGWLQETKLIASDGSLGDYFGYSVAIDGDTAVIGAYGDFFSGSAYVFRRDGSGWGQEAKLLSSDGGIKDFGKAVAVSGNTVVIGAPLDSENGPQAGAAYVFRRDGTTWAEEQKLLASDGGHIDWFGASVAISGELAVIGAYYDDNRNGSHAGAAYVFRYDGSAWVEEAKLVALTGATGDLFGWSVATSGDLALIGVRGDRTFRGAAYVFRYDGSSWIQEAKLRAGDWWPGDEFGYSVALSGDTAVIGARSDDDGGSAYVFRYDGSTWLQRAKLLPSDGASWDEFGISVAISGSTALIGAHRDDDNGQESGSLYVFGALGDCNANGTLDLCDVTEATSPDCNLNAVPDECEATTATLDIRPGACPNPFNRTSRGVLPVALLGTPDFDVTQVDTFSLLLSRADAVGGTVAPLDGPPGPRPVTGDIATPFDGGPCDCHELTGDGIDDLSMKFKTQDVVTALQLNDLPSGAEVELLVSGCLLDGTPFSARDCILLVPPSGAATLIVESNAADAYVEVTPLDLNGDGGGFVNFWRAYDPGTTVTLTAPASCGGHVFVRWEVAGAVQPEGQTTIQVMTGGVMNLKAVYRGQSGRLTPALGFAN